MRPMPLIVFCCTDAGLWRDKMMADGTFVEEAAPASSFYHIVCAIYELEDCLNTMETTAL